MFRVFLSACQKAYFQKCLSLRESQWLLYLICSLCSCCRNQIMFFYMNNRKKTQKKISIYVKNWEPYIQLTWHSNVQQNCLRLCFKCYCKESRKSEKVVNSLQYLVVSRKTYLQSLHMGLVLLLTAVGGRFCHCLYWNRIQFGFPLLLWKCKS